jgi:hypothetical protein
MIRNVDDCAHRTYLALAETKTPKLAKYYMRSPFFWDIMQR